MSKETIKVFTSFISNTASTLCNPRHVAILIIISQNLRCKARRFLMPYKDPEKRRAAARLGMQKMRAKEKGLTKTVNPNVTPVNPSTLSNLGILQEGKG